MTVTSLIGKDHSEITNLKNKILFNAKNISEGQTY